MSKTNWKKWQKDIFFRSTEKWSDGTNKLLPDSIRSQHNNVFSPTMGDHRIEINPLQKEKMPNNTGIFQTSRIIVIWEESSHRIPPTPGLWASVKQVLHLFGRPWCNQNVHQVLLDIISISFGKFRFLGKSCIFCMLDRLESVVTINKGETKWAALNLWNALNLKPFCPGSWNIHIIFISLDKHDVNVSAS